MEWVRAFQQRELELQCPMAGGEMAIGNLALEENVLMELGKLAQGQAGVIKLSRTMANKDVGFDLMRNRKYVNN